MKKTLLSLLLWSISVKVLCTTWIVGNSGNSFSPSTITVSPGDTINFDLSVSHDAVQVSQATWNANGTTALPGGFQTPFGGGKVFTSQLLPGTYFYVCTPHASQGMKGRIIVQNCTAPSQPVAINGNTSMCPGSLNNYTIAAVSGATSYTWTLPSGWTGSSTSTSISTTAGVNSGNISVVANNTCSSSPARTLSVTINSLPPTPGTINGNSTVCSGSSNAYSITPVSGATSYTWTLPSGWTGTSTSNSISTTSGAISGTINVTANNSCGPSPVRTLSITINNLQEIPGSISGNTTLCSGSAGTYTITAVSGATNYTWTLPSGWTGSSTSNSITTTAGTISGSISVVANNACGSSPPKTVGITINSRPATPEAISGNTTTCSGNVIIYSIAAVSGANGYTWTLPAGWIGSSNSNSISATAITTSGNISVTANNSCGSSTAKTLAVVINNPPPAPGNISGNISACAGSSNVYSITTVSGATSYIWTLPSGWSGVSTSNSISTTAGINSGTIRVTAINSCGSSAEKILSLTISNLPEIQGNISGNSTICPGSSNTYTITAVTGATNYSWTLPSGWTGVSTSNSITAIAGSSNGTLSVRANNSCGSSVLKSLNVIISNTLPTPDSVNGSAEVCPGKIYNYSIPAISGATNYTWSLPPGWIGNSTTNSMATTAGISGGTITVKANNSCGSSATRMLVVSTNGTAPPVPGTITGNASICAGSPGMYSILEISGVTSYTWTLPSGWTGSSTTNSIVVTAGLSGGNITVTANNSCGSSASKTLAVSTNGMAPSTPESISGKTSICAGSTSSYSIPPVNGATSYTWTLPFGWSGSSSTNSITVTAGSFNGLLFVAANNGCGVSLDKILGVSVSTVNADVTQTGTTLMSNAVGASYQWIDCSNGNQPMIGQSGQNFIPPVPGNYAVIVTQNNCQDTSSCFNLNTVGLFDHDTESAFSIYPNPSDGKLQMKIDPLSFKVNSRIGLYNLQGKLIYQSTINHPDVTIELNDRESGIFYLKLFTGKAIHTKLVVVL